ncbi:hypothetical protein [Paenibacillus elgii]|uniref:hypothetical protein n=1 Tax=Paenibacillus elgii TaxID=189691 RepID=UPI000248D211|nr:hypothetical protein [Paenibacillus elgii]
MNTYYGLALTQEGKSVIIENLANDYLTAYKDAEQQAAKEGLYFEGLRIIKGTQKGGSTMQKRFTSGEPTPRAKRK